jgi:hypothetical protein
MGVLMRGGAAARVVLAHDMAMHPELRRIVREVYVRSCVISTEPTARGLSEIDPFHSYAVRGSEIHGGGGVLISIGVQDVKYLKNKPISLLLQPQTPENRTQFLLLAKAQKEGFITVKLSLPEEAVHVRCLSVDCDTR